MLTVNNKIVIKGFINSARGDTIIDSYTVALSEKTNLALEEKKEKELVGSFSSAPNEYRMSVNKIYSGIDGDPSLCYLGAFAKMAQYHINDISFSDIVAYSGMGASAYCAETPEMRSPYMLLTKYGQSSMIQAAKNLNTEIGVGIKNGGTDSDRFPSNLSLIDEASKIKYFTDEVEALEFIKYILSTEKPVMIYINLYYVRDEFAEQSEYWQRMPKQQISHFITVTGYDDENIYINDPTDNTENGKDLALSTGNFVLAWSET